jgi:predicted metal-dependent hydrolase
MTKRKERADKIKLTAKDLKQIETMAGLGLTQEQISNVLGFSVDTLKRRLRENENELSALMGRGKTNALTKVAKKAYSLAIAGNTSMIKYFLGCQGGWSEKVQVINIPPETNENSQREYLRELFSSMSPTELEQYKKILLAKKKLEENAKERIKKDPLIQD